MIEDEWVDVYRRIADRLRDLAPSSDSSTSGQIRQDVFVFLETIRKEFPALYFKVISSSKKYAAMDESTKKEHLMGIGLSLTSARSHVQSSVTTRANIYDSNK